jgi:hypothetical protein
LQDEIGEFLRGAELGPDDFVEDDVMIEFTFHVTDGGAVQGSGTATVSTFGGQFGFCAIRDQQTPASVPVTVSGSYMGGQFELSLNPTGPASIRTRTWACDPPLLLRPSWALLTLVGADVETFTNVAPLGNVENAAAQTFMIPAQDGGTANPYVIPENRTISVEAVIHQIPYEGTWEVEGMHLVLSAISPTTFAADIRFRVAADNTISGDGTMRVTIAQPYIHAQCMFTNTPSMFSIPVRVLGRREDDMLRPELQPIDPPTITTTPVGVCGRAPSMWVGAPVGTPAALGLGLMGLPSIVIPVSDPRVEVTISTGDAQAVVRVRLQRPRL